MSDVDSHSTRKIVIFISLRILIRLTTLFMHDMRTKQKIKI